MCTPQQGVWSILCGALTYAALATSALAQAPYQQVPAGKLGVPNDAPVLTTYPVAQQPAQVTIDHETLQKIVRDEIQADKAKALPETKSTADDRSLSAKWDNGFVAQTADKAFRIHLGGRFEFDNTWFTQDANILLGTSNTQRLIDGSLFRRARLRADGTMWDWIDFAVEVNFANIQDASNVQDQPVQVGSVGLNDMFLTFREVPIVGNLRVGHLQAPVGLERLSSSNAWYYMERSSIYDAFLGPNDYQNGIMAFDSYFDDRVTLAASFTRVGKSTVQSFGFDAEDGAYAGAARLTCLPYYDCDGRYLMHLGAGYQHAALVGDQFAVANRPLLRSGSGFGSDTPNVVATGTYFTPDGADIADFEWATVLGPFSLSAEYAFAHVSNVFDTFNGLTFAGPHGDVTYQAAYAEGGFFLTGENRRYDKKTGTWARTIPTNNVINPMDNCDCITGCGAVQLVARYTYLDLVSGDPVLSQTSGARAGRQHDMTLGVNWYLNPQVWIMANYILTHVDSTVPGASGDFQGFGVRVHVDF
ncbi:MAG TPA: porin [Gemmataceae bacterium]|nr:porin [Gemmataceae bacterium]